MTIGDGPRATAPPDRPGVVDRARSLLRDQRVLFLMIGGINTVLGMIVFIGVDLALGRIIDVAVNPTVGSIATLAVAHVISVVIAFILHRRLVFRAHGHVWLDFIRFQGVYAVTFTVNLVLLPISVAVGVPRIAAQAAIVTVMTVVSYFAHRHFSFRRKPESLGDSSKVEPRK